MKGKLNWWTWFEVLLPVGVSASLTHMEAEDLASSNAELQDHDCGSDPTPFLEPLPHISHIVCKMTSYFRLFI